MVILQSIPQDFQLRYEFVSGSVPPPYHYEYVVNIDAKGNGTIIYKPDYAFGNIPNWNEQFIVSADKLELFWKLLEKNKYFKKNWKVPERNPVGGSLVYMEVTANGKKVEISPFTTEKELAEEFRKSAIELVPQNVMDSLAAKRDKYIDEYKKK